MESILLIVLMFGIIYVMMIRPENKKRKAEEEMRSNMKKGDTITSIGGIVGKVVRVNEDTVIIETSEDRVRMEITKWAVSKVGDVQKSVSEQPEKKKKEKAEALPEKKD